VKYWLMKCEPSAYSIDDLEADKVTPWEGVRNYQARNLLRDEIKSGDGVLFYQSNAKQIGVVGLAKVCKSGYPDHFSWAEGHHYWDPKSTPENPIWYMVDIAFVNRIEPIITLAEIKSNPDLEGIMVARRGSRLSVQPVEERHFNIILKLANLTLSS